MNKSQEHAQFVMRNGKANFPDVTSDNLQVWYDVKGKKDTDFYKDTLIDLSGNGKDATLHNFAFEKRSGYLDDGGLLFDDVDDKLVYPSVKSNLTYTTATTGTPAYPVMTYQYNGNIISYEADGTVKRMDDGRVITRKGINLVRNGNFADGVKGWFTTNGISEMSRSDAGGVELSLLNNLATHARISQDLSINSSIGTALYFKIKVTTLSENINYCRVFLRDGTGGAVIANKTAQIYNQVMGQTYELEAIAVNDAELVNNKIYVMADFYRKGDTTEKLSVRIEDIQVINLTEAYGAGNEPSLEHIQAHPEEFAWTPNPNDLIEVHEIKNNLVGDLEDLHGAGDKTEILSGTEIFTDKADDSVVHVDIDGKSVGGGSGKNLLRQLFGAYAPYNTVPVWNEGFNKITFTMNATGYTAVAVRGWRPENKTYTLSGVMKKNGLPVKRSDWANSSANTTATVHSLSVDDTTGRFEVTQTWNGSHEWILHANFNTAIGDVVTIENFQLEEGSTATAYELPAPSPDYPIAIHSLNDFDVVSSVGNRNLALDTSKEFTNVRVGTYSGSLAGVATSRFTYTLEELGVQVGDTMTTSMYVGESKEGYGGGFRIDDQSGSNKYSTHKVAKNGYVSETFTILEGTTEIRLYTTGISHSGASEDFNLPVKELKLEKGNKETDWTPAPEDISKSDNHPLIDKTNILLSEPLRSVDDVKDRLFRDSDGLWKIERNVGILDLSKTPWNIGAESSGWKQNGDTISGYNYALRNISNPSVAPVLHNLRGYAQSPLVGADVEGFSVGTSNNYSTLRINKSRLPSLTQASITQWLKENNVMAHYALISPTIEILPQADQDKLNNIASYKDSNYLYTVVDKTNILPSYVRDNLKPNLNAKFRKLSWFWSRLLFYQLKIWSKNLTDDELIHEYKINKRRWGM